MKIKLFVFIIMLIILTCLNLESKIEDMLRELDQSKIHDVGLINLRVSNHGTWGANGNEWPSLEYPSNSGIDWLRIGSLWFGAKKVRRNFMGQKLYWLHWPPLDEDDIVAENEPGWTPDLQLVVDTLTTVGYDGDYDLWEFLPAYNPLEEDALGGQYQMYNSSDIVVEISIIEQKRGFDDDGDGLIDEDPIGYAFPFRAGDELPPVFSVYGGEWLHNSQGSYGTDIITDNYDIWFPFEYVDLADDFNENYNFTHPKDDDCDGLYEEDGYPVSEQDFISYYYDYSPFGTGPERDLGAGAEENHHGYVEQLNIRVRQMSHQWSYNYLSNIIFLEFSITNMNNQDDLYDCTAGFFVDPEIGPQYWNEADRRYDDVSSYVSGEGYEFAYAYDADFDNGLSTGYTGTMLCSPDPDEFVFNCWTWDLGNGPDDSNPLELNPIGITSNEKYWLLTGRNPDDNRFISLREFPGTQVNYPCDTRYLYTIYGDMQGMTNPTNSSWNIGPFQTMKIVIALFADEEYLAFQNQALWVKTIYGNSQSLAGSCLPDTINHFAGPVPPKAPKLFAELDENQNDIYLYWENRSEIDNYDTFQVHQALMGWQDHIPGIDSYAIGADTTGMPEEYWPNNWGIDNINALVNPWTGYRLRHDFQGYSLWGKPGSSANDQWILYSKYDKIDTAQDMQDYMVNYGTGYFIDFGGDLGIDTGLPNQQIAVTEDQQYYHYDEMYELVPYQIGETISGFPIYDATKQIENIPPDIYSWNWYDQSSWFKHPDMRDDIYLALYDEILIPLENHLGGNYVNNGIENPDHIKDRLARRYYVDDINDPPWDLNYNVSVTAWDRGMPANNIQSLDSGKWINTISLITIPNDFIVWPGDTNYSGNVDENDIDAIAIFWKEEGDPRSSISFEWIGNDIPDNWIEPYAPLADCNGDGEVNITDVLALCLNWWKSHETFSSCVSFSDEELLEKRDNFIEIYNSLGNSNIEIRIKNHIAEKFNLPLIEIIAVNKLYNNFPNPFNPTTMIKYSIAEKGNVELSIYNIKGQLVKKYQKDNQDSGSYSTIWNGLDMNNKKVSSGIYFYKLENNRKTIDTKKMLLIK